MLETASPHTPDLFKSPSFQGLPHHFDRILNRGMMADRQCIESLDKAGDDISSGSKFKRKKSKLSGAAATETHLLARIQDRGMNAP